MIANLGTLPTLWLAALVATGAVQPAHAQAAKPALGIPSSTDAAAQLTRPFAQGNAAAGRKLAEARCTACHGIDGLSKGFPEYPRIAGQLRGYLYLQLVNFSTGERPHPVMAPMISGLNNRQLQDLAAHYASAPSAPVVSAASKPDLELGARLFKEGAVQRGIPACAWCHGAQGQGNAPVFARIGGQHAAYTVGMLQLFKDKPDFNNPYAFVMKAVPTPMTQAEMRAVAEYASTLK
jgi:cytochrome c553